MTAPQLLKPSLLVPAHLAPLFLAFGALSEKVCGKKLISRGWTLNDRGRGQCFRNRQYMFQIFKIAFGAGRSATIGEGSTHQQCKQCSTPARTPEAHRDVQRVEQLRDSDCFLTLWCPQPPLPLPLPLPAIADGVAAAFPLDGPIGLRLHRAVTALIRDHHLVAVSNRTHPKNVFVRPSWPELHRSSPHCPRPLKPDASRAMYARRVTSWVCLGRQR